MTAPPVGAAPAPDAAAAVDNPACPCGGEMWFLRFGYESWVCRRNTRHWFRPALERWSRDAQALTAASSTEG